MSIDQKMGVTAAAATATAAAAAVTVTVTPGVGVEDDPVKPLDPLIHSADRLRDTPPQDIYMEFHQPVC
jgi:hypothetical protein